MPNPEPIKMLAVRMTESQHRRIKATAAMRGLSLQQAVQQALEAWLAHPQPKRKK